MGLLFVILLCVAIHCEIVNGAWNGLFERIFDTIHVFITDDEMALNEMFSSGKSSPGKAEENCKTKTRERDVWHHLLAESFYNFKEAVDILKMFAREFTEGYVKENDLFLEFYGAQNDTRNNTLIRFNCCTLKLVEAGRFVDDAIRCLSEPSFFQSYENKPQLCCIHSMVCSDFVWRTLSPNNSFNDKVVVVGHNAFISQRPHSNLGNYGSAKWLTSSDSLHGFNETGITFENIPWERNITIVVENHYTEILISFFTYSGRLSYNSFLENQRIGVYRNTRESFSEINFHIYDSPSYDASCCLKNISESECAGGYKIQHFLTLNVCLNGTTVALLTHTLFLEKYFTAVHSYRMSRIKMNGSYIYTCPLVQFMNVSPKTIIGYFISKNKFFYRSRPTFPANISFCKIDVKDCILKDIFTLHSSKNITFSSNISILKEVFMDCLCVCSVCKISYAYLFLSDCAIRNPRLQFLYKTSMNSSRSTVVTMVELQIYFLNSSMDDKGSIDYSVFDININSSHEELVFPGTISVNQTKKLRISLIIQNAYENYVWHFHSEYHNSKDRNNSVDNWTTGLSDVNMFGTGMNFFEKLIPLRHTRIESKKLGNHFAFKEKNKDWRQSGKLNLLKLVAKKVIFRTQKHCFFNYFNRALLSKRKLNDTSKYRRKSLKRLFTTLGHRTRKKYQLYKPRLEKKRNFEHPISEWRISNLLWKSVFENNSRIDMPKWKIDVSNNSVTYRCNMLYTEHPDSDSNITDLSASLNNSISRNVSSMRVKLKNLPWKLNKDHHVLMFAIFSTRIIRESYGHNKTICKNSTRTLVKCMNTGDNTCCFTIFQNLNYSGISLIQKAILSSYNASTRSSSILKEELWDSLKCCFSWIFCNILIGFLFLKFQTFKFMSDDDKENHNFQSCSQSTKFPPLDVTGTLKELDNIRAVGYLDHTIHVFFVTEIVVEAFILGYIWKFQFFPCFMDTLNRRRTGSELLNKLNFKIQIKSVSLYLCIKYNSPTNGITQIQTRVPDLNGSKESSYEETCQNERSMCTSKYNFADCSLFSTASSSLSFSETEDSDDEDLHWKSKTDNCDDAQTLKYDTDSLKEMLENRKVRESYGIREYDYHVSQKNNIQSKFVKYTDDHEIDQTFVEYQQSLLNEDGEDNETSLKTIERDSVTTYLDSSLSGDIDDLNDPNISPRDRLKPNECINSKGLSSGKKCIEIKRIGDCIFSCNEFINTGKDFDNVHIYSDIDDNSLNAMSTYDSNKIKSKRNDSVVLSSLRSRPTSCRFENVDYHHRCIDFKQNSHKQFRKQAKETCVFPTAINIVTSSSKNKETQWCPNITTSPCIYIAQGVRKFLKRYRTRQRRRFLQTIRQYTSRFQDIKTEEIIICYPVFAKEASSNTTDQRQVSLPLPESSQAQGLQNVLAENQCSAYQSSDYESSLGTLSSIFNDVSIQSLNENDRYQYEWIRLASFSNFSSETVHATRLARGGWYSTGNGDQTACFSCHKIHDNWIREDDPSWSTLHDPNCRFMLRISNNRPIPRESTIHRDLSSESLLNENTTRDHTEPPNQQMNSEDASVLSENLSSPNTLHFTNAPSEDRSETHLASQTLVAQAATSEGTRGSQLDALMRDPMGINFDRPKYPSYAILATRLSSYSDWPASMTQTPRDMALAGFFYAGHGDYTRCFFCGGGLRNWEAGDDPWVEHARWFSKCAFVRQNRGQQFIDLVLRRAAEMEQQQTENQHGDTTENKRAKEAKIMNSAAVRSIKDMGYSEEKIKEAIDTIKSRLPRGKHKVSAHEILEVLFELADRSSRGVTRPSEPAPQHSEPTVANQSYGHQSSTNLTPNTNAEGATSAVNSLTLNDLESLQRENTSLKDQIVCKICMEKNVSIAFLPCGHLACCADCAPAMRKCPICREFVRGTVKTYLV